MRLQVSERIIKSTYKPLEEVTQKRLTNNESSLYYKDKKVYKIFNKMYRLNRENFIWMIHEKKFDYAINIEDELYQGDKLIGCTTLYDKNFLTFNEMLESYNPDLYTLKQFVQMLLHLDNQLIKYNLAYFDKHLSNIGLSNSSLKVVDLDGVWNNAFKQYATFAKLKSYHFLFLLLFKNSNLLGEIEFLNSLPFNFNNLEEIEKFVLNMSPMQAFDLQEKYLIYKRN